MALIRCYECGAQISSEAPACPQCGAVARPGRPRKRWPFVALGCLISLFIVIGFSCIVCFPALNRAREAARAATARQTSPPQTSGPLSVSAETPLQGSLPRVETQSPETAVASAPPLLPPIRRGDLTFTLQAAIIGSVPLTCSGAFP